MQKTKQRSLSPVKRSVISKPAKHNPHRQVSSTLSHISTRSRPNSSFSSPSSSVQSWERQTQTRTHRKQVSAVISRRALNYQPVRSFADSMIPAADNQSVDTIRHELHDTPLTKEALDENPIKQFHTWFHEAVGADSFMPERMVVSTVKLHKDGNIQPSSRPVLLKDMIIGEQMISPYQIMLPSKDIPALSTPSFFPISPEECTKHGVNPSIFDQNISKQIRHQGGFTFVTNYGSDKAQQIDSNPYCSLLFHWVELERVVRIEGTIMKVPSELSDVYHLGRPRNSRVSAMTSHQSHPIASRQELEDRYVAIDKALLTEEYQNISGYEHVKKPEGIPAAEFVPRPPHWGGYVIIPHEFEFWQGRKSRFHERIRYRFAGDGSLLVQNETLPQDAVSEANPHGWVLEYLQP